uniref:Uncharacterized protein n=1 Tax=Arundo donax TaxID=35708 RepID=A0A0A8ZQC6_ARUDO
MVHILSNTPSALTSCQYRRPQSSVSRLYNTGDGCGW